MLSAESRMIYLCFPYSFGNCFVSCRSFEKQAGGSFQTINTRSRGPERLRVTTIQMESALIFHEEGLFVNWLGGNLLIGEQISRVFQSLASREFF